MTLYAVKNAEGKWFGYEIYSSEPGWFENGGITWDYSGAAELTVHKHGGHVVELVEKPKRWNIKVPHTKELYYYVNLNGDLNVSVAHYDALNHDAFTATEIEHYGLTNCEKVEVSNKEEKLGVSDKGEKEEKYE